MVSIEGAGERGLLENEGPDQGKADPDVMWHLAGQCLGVEAVRTTDRLARAKGRSSEVAGADGGAQRRAQRTKLPTLM